MRYLSLIVVAALSLVLASAVPTEWKRQSGVEKTVLRGAVRSGVLKTTVRKKKSGFKLPKSKSGGGEEEEFEEEDTVDQVSDEVDEVVEEGKDALDEAEEALDDAKEEAENFFSCFPASATVQTTGGLQIRMEDLSLGESVVVGHEESHVFMFTHADRDGMHPFVRLTTSSGHALSLSGGHFLYADDTLKRADSVSVGDNLRLADGASSPVVDVVVTRERGLYNPQTLHGNIAVNGIVTSTYTAAVEPKVAHALLAPARMAFSWFGYTSSLFEKGAPEGLKNTLLPIGRAL